VKLTDSAPAPLQEAAVVALESPAAYYRQLKDEYEERRDLVCDALEAAGFDVGTRPKGGFFVFARIPERDRRSLDDVRYHLFVKPVGNLGILCDDSICGASSQLSCFDWHCISSTSSLLLGRQLI
jgi:DNA-binding transcriptional MocR family regulator